MPTCGAFCVVNTILETYKSVDVMMRSGNELILTTEANLSSLLDRHRPLRE